MFYIEGDRIIQVINDKHFIIAVRFISRFYKRKTIPFSPQNCKFTYLPVGRFNSNDEEAHKRFIFMLYNVEDISPSYVLKMFFPRTEDEEKRVNTEINFNKIWHQYFPQFSLLVDYKISRGVGYAGALLLKYVNFIKWSDLSFDKHEKAIHSLIQQFKMFHSLGYSHNDIAPKNILVTPEGDVFIIDFENVKHDSNSIKDIASLKLLFEPHNIQMLILDNADDLTPEEIEQLEMENISYKSLHRIMNIIISEN